MSVGLLICYRCRAELSQVDHDCMVVCMECGRVVGLDDRLFVDPENLAFLYCGPCADEDEAENG